MPFGTSKSTDGMSIRSELASFIGFEPMQQEDMSRAEELTTKLRTLTYDHERMVSMHRKATEQSANAEREMNLHKSRLT